MLLVLFCIAFFLGIVLAILFGMVKNSKQQAEKYYLVENLEKTTLENKQLTEKHDELDKNYQALIIEESRLRAGFEYLQNETLNELRDRLEQQQNIISIKDKEIKVLTEQNQRLEVDATKLNTYLSEREEHFKQQFKQLNENKEMLSKEFENLANKIFEEKGKNFKESNQQELAVLLKPFREQIEGFQKRVNEVHDESVKGNSSLATEIKKVMEIGLSMSEEASSLTNALKGSSQKRGAWGEAQLQKTLELGGLIENAHFQKQTSFRDEEGKIKITDFIINLPDKKHIIIDSKVSLNAFERVINAADQLELDKALKEHLTAVKKHIDDLSSKDYTALSGIDSPSFVLMFMPIESAYIEALRYQPEIFDYGYQKNIVIVSHTTLLPILRTVSNLWMIEKSTSEVREISERAGDIYNQVSVLADRLQKLGNSLGTVSTHYNSTVTALAGQQGLYGKVDRFNQLSAKTMKELPDIELRHIDYHVERLEGITSQQEDDK